jgi:Site-specific recombinase XerD
MDYRTEAPEIIKGFLIYHETIKGHSRRTVDEYFLDLRTFFRFIKLEKGKVPRDTELRDIPINDVDLDLVKSVTLTDVYSYLTYLSRDRVRQYRESTPEYGLNAKSRARKIAAIRSYYKYLTVKAHILDESPVQDLDSPKVMKSLPHYLTLEESEKLLNSVDGTNKERDFCIITIFLNCGLRISEVVGLNLTDIQKDHLRVLGKGNKERIVYLNEACIDSINSYLAVRKKIVAIDKNAFFLSNRRRRISRETVHHLVKNYITAAGLDSKSLSSHKLRHTAATLMLQNGVDIRTLQELLGHEHLNTTEIYTHISNTELQIAAKANPLGHFKADKNK